jgi:hypothetical protein
MNRLVDFSGIDARRTEGRSIASARQRAFGRSSISISAIRLSANSLSAIRHPAFMFIALFLIASNALAAEPDRPSEAAIRSAVERSAPLIQATGAKYRSQRECFSCHHQAIPAIALEIASNHGFAIDRAELKAQGKHALDDLARNAKGYREGKGQGGGVVRAGYALWTISVAGIEPDETTAAVVHYLLVHDDKYGYWKTSSHRPPSEASDFTATGVALVGLTRFAGESDRAAFEARKSKALAWLESRRPKDAEDRVFRLWGLKYAGGDRAAIDSAVQDLIQSQREDGGWGQTDDRASDAYATGSALVALAVAGDVETDHQSYIKGLAYLLKTQLADGSWRVESVSRPFQTYFESGFPHGDDQFISAAATSWSIAALALAIPIRSDKPTKIDRDRSRAGPIPSSDLAGSIGSKRASKRSRNVQDNVHDNSEGDRR